MDYTFPTIEHIDDVLPAIKENPAIGVMQRGSFTIINYHYQSFDTFDGPNESITRECRGLIFDTASGKVINRRYHKFYNVGEKDNTQVGVLPFDRPHVIMDKLDGSMISPAPVGGDLSALVWCTKMGDTDVAKNAAEFVATRPSYVRFAKHTLEDGYTPIFEWCSPKNRIVVDYGTDKLVLTGIRHTKTGEYKHISQATFIAALAGLDTVPFVETQAGDADFIARARLEEGREGYVVQFDNGHMVKVKNEWYVGIHKAKDLISSPRRILINVLNNTLDDVISLIPVSDKAKTIAYVQTYEKHLREAVGNYQATRDQYIRAGVSRKDFALTLAHKHAYPSVFFESWDGAISVEESVKRIVEKAVQSDKAFAETMPKLLGWENANVVS